MNTRDLAGVLELLVLQPTPFCNIACDYCYLPHRNDSRRMPPAILDATLALVFGGHLSGPRLSVVWHAGEPLVLPVKYYEAAFDLVELRRPPEIVVTHNIQTNATLIDDNWCSFLVQRGVRLGVSIDGPERLHDRHRKTRSGRGTHATVMRGIKVLRDHHVPFHVICVLTRESLHVPDELFDFFSQIGTQYLCFNVEELEGVNSTSSLNSGPVEEEYRAFWDRFIERTMEEQVPFRVREIDNVLGALRHPLFGTVSGNSENQPLRILSVACNGDVGTFSPELLGVSHAKYGGFAIGNVVTHSAATICQGSAFERIAYDVESGVAMCKRTCKYFDFCCGGAPSNKLAENGTFASTETMFCRLSRKVQTDCVLRAIEKGLTMNVREHAA